MELKGIDNFEGWKTCREYWKDYVCDLLECYIDEIELTDTQLDTIVDSLMNNDHFWTAIDEYVMEEIDYRIGLDNVRKEND